ncbi:MAG TPA: transglycosylase family protein [Acidimicrobiales bacterium]|nr:transglycosylase family protein [Acidimicrobiales bacterium]
MQKLKAIAAATAVATTIIGGGASMASADTAHSGDTLSGLYPDSWRYVCVVNVAEGRIPDCDTLINGQEIRGQVSAQDRHNIDVWFANVPHQPVVVERSEVSESSSANQSSQQTSTYQAPEQQPVYSGGGGSCVPDYIVQRESGGDYGAENPTSTASGKYQFLDGTWNGYGGYQHASDAPPAVQDARACEVWANGAGASHWAVP